MAAQAGQVVGLALKRRQAVIMQRAGQGRTDTLIVTESSCQGPVMGPKTQHEPSWLALRGVSPYLGGVPCAALGGQRTLLVECPSAPVGALVGSCRQGLGIFILLWWRG